MHNLESSWEAVKREFDRVASQVEHSARFELSGELNRICRRLLHYEKEEQWIAALGDGIALAASDFAIFTVKEGSLRLRSQQGLSLPDNYELPASSAAGFTAAIESRDSVVTLRAPREVGELLRAEDLAARAHLFPIVNAKRVVAIVFAVENGLLDANAAELVTGIAGSALERRSNQGVHAQIGPAANPAKLGRTFPAWVDLTGEDRSLHAKAQRFSRVAVAEMQLARPEACRSGREQNNVYMFLQSEIDKARETYGRQFMTVPSMIDYLHLELLNVAAEGDERKLGADYPGHLV